MTDRLILADATTDPRDFARSLGLNLRTPEQKAAEWQAECERFADMIEAGNEWAVPPAYLRDARAIVDERGILGLTEEVRGDPFLKQRRVA